MKKMIAGAAIAAAVVIPAATVYAEEPEKAQADLEAAQEAESQAAKEEGQARAEKEEASAQADAAKKDMAEKEEAHQNMRPLQTI